MAHIVFVDSSSVGLGAFETACSLGHHVTFVKARDISSLEVNRVPTERIDDALRHVHEVITINELERDLVGAVMELHARRSIDAVLTTSEFAALPAAGAAEAIGVPCTPWANLRDAVRKDLCRERLYEAGVRSPRHVSVRNLTQARRAVSELGLPAVIKPSRGTAKEAAAVLRYDGDLDAYFKEFEASRGVRPNVIRQYLNMGLIVESYLEGPLYSAEIAARGGDLQVLMLTRRERAAHNEIFEVAAIMPSGLTLDQTAQTEQYMREVFAALGLTFGLFHIEFIITSDGPTLVEVNGRMMGGMLPVIYQHVTGVDPFAILAQEHLGANATLPKATIERAGIVVAVGSVDGGTVSADAERRVAEIVKKYQPVRHALTVQGGQQVPSFAGNFTVLGYFCLGATDYVEAHHRGRRLLAELSRALELPLATYSSS